MKILPYGCKGTLAPFSNNYCVDCLIVHGCIFLVGIIFIVTERMLYGFSQIGALIGIGMCLVAVLAGIINLAIDRNFRA